MSNTSYYNHYLAKLEKSKEPVKRSKPAVVYSVTNSDGERFEIAPGETRVIFIGEGYFPTPRYPCWDSQHACVGTVQDVSMHGGVTVKWDNGSTSKVLGKDLAPHQGDEPTPPAREKNPNTAFRLEKLKKTPEKTWSDHSGWRDPNYIEPDPEYVKKVQAMEAVTSFDSYVTVDNIVDFHNKIGFHDEDEHDR